VKIALLIPGNAGTLNFALSLGDLMDYLKGAGHEVTKRHLYYPVLHHGRNLLLLERESGEEVPMHVNAVPLGFEYDKMLWLETDMVFRPEDAMKLLEADADVVSALYPMNPKLKNVAVAGTLPNMRIVLSAAKEQKADLLEVDFCGFGMVAVRKGVFEAMGYPWFDTLYETHDDGTVEYLGDDFGWCKKVKALGYRIHVHNRVRVGHEKAVVV
jgi:hypothetical protein